MTAATSERLIALEIAYNVRHIGGYLAGEKRTSESLIRAGSLHRLTPESVDRLRELNVRAVVDFRSARELEQNPTPASVASAMKVTHTPVFSSDASPAGLGKEFPGFGVVYERFLADGMTAYRTMAEVIIGTDGAILFHCSAGKDRTGVASALLLDLAGVDTETIIADYAETERHIGPEMAVWIERMKDREMPEDLARRLLTSDAEDMATTLDTLRRRWGGAAGYFEATGLTSSQIDELKDRVLA